MTARIQYSNPNAASAETSTAPAAEFHRTMAGYRATPLTEIPALAAELGVGYVFVKDESNRFGLPAFKALGASWASARVVWSAAGRAGLPAGFDELRVAAESVPQLTLVTATDGNHGRAVARVAALLGLGARIYVPRDTSESTCDAIRGEGAKLIELPEIYDDVVRAAAASVDPATDRLVQDTSWGGYTEVPQWIVDGYGTLFDEIAKQAPGPVDVVVIPTGVGSLLQAAVEHGRGARVLCVEP
ncbi:MAG: pyridoxal-phosphate dependent enzyme, partial [Rhodoglobus sp.]|nr:pyridoxal-phosphate dependent enzyme [Rhodoglobus sp.]